jgi:hypothetical protein
MSDGFRRDLTLAKGAGFRLRRRLSARIFSALLALAAFGWGAGEEVPLVEGDELEVRRIAERLAGSLKEPPDMLN